MWARSWNAIAPSRLASSLVQATMALHVGAGVLLVLAMITWTPERSPRWLLAALAAGAFTLAAHAARRGDRLSLREVWLMTAAVMMALGVLTSTTGIDLGVLANGAILPMLSVYVVWFMPGPPGRVLLYGGSLWWFVAVVQRGETLLTGLAVTLVLQVIIAAEVFAVVRARSDRLARVDELTGALNRRGLTEACEDALERVVARGTPFSIISIDLDGLRHVNNEQGHRAGDALLVQARAHWRTHLRARDLIGRVGGDEFVIVLPATDAQAAMEVKRRLRFGSTLTWSAGVAQARPDDTLASLLHRADERMYRQKAERAAS